MSTETQRYNKADTHEECPACRGGRAGRGRICRQGTTKPLTAGPRTHLFQPIRLQSSVIRTPYGQCSSRQYRTGLQCGPDQVKGASYLIPHRIEWRYKELWPCASQSSISRLTIRVLSASQKCYHVHIEWQSPHAVHRVRTPLTNHPRARRMQM